MKTLKDEKAKLQKQLNDYNQPLAPVKESLGEQPSNTGPEEEHDTEIVSNLERQIEQLKEEKEEMREEFERMKMLLESEIAKLRKELEKMR